MSIKQINFIDLIVFGLFRLIRGLFFFLPRRLCLLTGAALGSGLFYADKKHRRLALANLEKAFGRELSLAQRRRVARDSFKNFGRVIADDLKWMHLGESRRKKLLTIEGEDNIRRALTGGKGVLLFSAHLGNWEVASLAISGIGRFSVVARPLDNRLLEKELTRFRQSLGAQIISKFQAAKPILESLRRNEIVAILIDQNVLRSQAVFVDFFGVPAATTPSLASFHLRTRSPILPVFCYATPSWAYVVKVGPPLDIGVSGDPKQDVLKITQCSTKMIEAEIRERPSHWFWFHSRWKSRPESEAAAQERAAGEKDG
jgi:Kdo2-lipid IVA lauroyltransferase/acyltransferase